jgi:hypothetical protein
MASYQNGAMPPRRQRWLEGSEEFRTLNVRLRLAFLAAAEERSRRVMGRALAPDELERILRHYPGDLPAPIGDADGTTDPGG